MSNLNDAIERIKVIQCPAEDVADKIEGILKEYGVSINDHVKVNREAASVMDGDHIYNAEIQDQENKSLLITAKTGSEDYVAKVVDVTLQ